MKALDTPQADWQEEKSLLSALRRWQAERGDRPAVCHDGRTLTWSESVPRVLRAADALRTAGVTPGTRVAWLARNSVAVHEVFLGTLLARGCAVPLPTMASEGALALMLADANARIMMVTEEFRGVVDALRQAPHAITTFVALDFEADGFENYERWLAAAEPTPPESAIEPADEFNIIYSSGTTGIPKGILHRHRMRNGHAARYEDSIPEGSVNLVSTPLYSNTTIVLWYPSVMHGATTVLMSKFDPQKWLALTEQHRVTHAMLVPVQYDRLLREPELTERDLSSLRYKFCTSAPMREDLKRKAVFDIPGRFTEYYGLTEGGIATILFGNDHPDKLGSVGKCYNGELRIIDEQGQELPPGRTGEIVGRNQLMMEGYVNRTQATDSILWRDAEGNLFFKSGDVGRLDEDGFLYLSDRKKDVIISGGFNVYATDLETVLDRHPQVHEVAVIGVPSEQWGETPMALVVLEPGAQVTESDVLQWANEQLGKGQRLGALEFRTELPKSEIGKILKRQLRQPYWPNQS